MSADTDLTSNLARATIETTKSANGLVTLKAYLPIAGKRAELVLPEWLDAGTLDLDAATRTALQRAALSFLEEFTAEGD